MNSHAFGRNTVHLLIFIGAVLGPFARAETFSVEFNATTPGLVIGPDFLSRTVNGITITARGYTAEFDGPNTSIFGPYPTSDGAFGLQVFGPTVSGFTNRPGFGLLSQPLPGIVTSGIDFGGATYAPGFDNGLNGRYLGDNPDVPGLQLPKIEFALFSFSSPVDVSQVLVHGATRPIWAAGGLTAPDLSGSLLHAFSGFLIQSSLDDAGDGFFTHNFNDFTAVSYLAVGTPTHRSTVGEFGPFPTAFGTEFYVVGLGLEPASPVPEPSTFTLMLLGLATVLGVAALSRSRRSAGSAIMAATGG